MTHVYCPECGFQNPEAANYCAKCGALLVRDSGAETTMAYTLDGIKVFDERGWAQVLPDPDEPVIHLYAEGRTREESQELQRELRELVQEIMAGEPAAAGA